MLLFVDSIMQKRTSEVWVDRTPVTINLESNSQVEEHYLIDDKHQSENGKYLWIFKGNDSDARTKCFSVVNLNFEKFWKVVPCKMRPLEKISYICEYPIPTDDVHNDTVFGFGTVLYQQQCFNMDQYAILHDTSCMAWGLLRDVR